ncbi:MAG: phenylacetate-CoA oxygenase subunit PaaJ [Chloroflexi bacterium]|nr:phenylacetate-CoA oxygenase subunit PaaJ [Chloroflexota bacterium]
MDKPKITEQTIWDILNTVPDPEIPVVSMVELGIVQDVQLHDDESVTVKMTPTFAGCPALQMMQDDMRDALMDAGIKRVEIKVVLDPPWTSDRITDEARQKMADFGIAPPHKLHGKTDGAMIMLMEKPKCPFCESGNTHLENPFGPTLCRAIYYCDNCQQPFELFKPL